MIALDTEYTPITAANPIPRLAAVSFSDDTGSVLYAAHDPRLLGAVVRAFKRGVVLHTAPVDVFVLWAHFGHSMWPIIREAYEAGRVWDVATAEKKINYAAGIKENAYSLAALAYRRLGLVMDKGEDTDRMHYGRWIGIDTDQWPESAVRYAKLDAIATWLIYKQQRAQMDVLASLPYEAMAHLTWYAQTLRGIRTDQRQVDRVEARLTAEIERLGQLCIDHGLARLKWKRKRPSPIVKSEINARKMLADLAKADPRVRLSYTETGLVSIAAKALEEAGIPELVACACDRGQLHNDWYTPDCPRCSNTGQVAHPLRDYAALDSAQTMRTSWIRKLRAPVIRTRYGETVESGRTSSKEPGDPWIGRNLQNFPKVGGFRECLVPRPGYEFVQDDFGSLELVALAQVQLDYFGRSALAEVLRAGRDPHAEFACKLLKIDPSQFDKEIKEHAEARNLAKCWNFGKPGGMGQDTFIKWCKATYGVVVTPAEEKRYTAEWLATFPEMQMFFDKVRSLGQGSRRNRTYRIRFRSGHVRGGMWYPDACNTHFQNLGAWIAKRAAWLLFVARWDPTSPLYGCNQVLFVHDEFLTEAPLGRGEAAQAEQRRLMIQAANECCPDVPMTVDGYIGLRYKKD